MSIHREKLEAVVQRAIQDILGRGLHDPRIKGLVSVTRVQLSADLADATVFVSITPEEHETLTMHGLKAATAHVRSGLGRIAHLRRVPRVAFKLDASHKQEVQILGELSRLRQEGDDMQGNSES